MLIYVDQSSTNKNLFNLKLIDSKTYLGKWTRGPSSNVNIK